MKEKAVAEQDNRLGSWGEINRKRTNKVINEVFLKTPEKFEPWEELQREIDDLASQLTTLDQKVRETNNRAELLAVDYTLKDAIANIGRLADKLITHDGFTTVIREIMKRLSSDDTLSLDDESYSVKVEDEIGRELQAIESLVYQLEQELEAIKNFKNRIDGDIPLETDEEELFDAIESKIVGLIGSKEDEGKVKTMIKNDSLYRELNLFNDALNDIIDKKKGNS